MCGKLSELHYKETLVSNRREKVMNWRKTVGQICPIVFLAFQTFSPGFENNHTLKCGSESFPRIMTYILCVEKCQSYIFTHGCVPIAGKLFYNVRKFRGCRISECNNSKLLESTFLAIRFFIPTEKIRHLGHFLLFIRPLGHLEE